MRLQRKLSNGNYIDCDLDYVDRMIVRAIEFDQGYPNDFRGKLGLQTYEDAIKALKAGYELQHGTDWYDSIRDGEAYERKLDVARAKRDADPNYSNEGWNLDCGCIVHHRSHIMSASRGSACIDCYDRMSN